MPITTPNVTVHYSGNVQGVGFRYTTSRIAGAHPDISGYVKNLPDGRVELFAEGSTDSLRKFIADISSQMSVFIRDTNVAAGQGPRHYTSFGISH